MKFYSQHSNLSKNIQKQSKIIIKKMLAEKMLAEKIFIFKLLKTGYS